DPPVGHLQFGGRAVPVAHRPRPVHDPVAGPGGGHHPDPAAGAVGRPPPPRPPAPRGRPGGAGGGPDAPVPRPQEVRRSPRSAGGGGGGGGGVGVAVRGGPPARGAPWVVVRRLSPKRMGPGAAPDLPNRGSSLVAASTVNTPRPRPARVPPPAAPAVAQSGQQ